MGPHTTASILETATAILLFGAPVKKSVPVLHLVREGRPHLRKQLFSAILLASVLAFPIAAHADAIDDFVLTGSGQTISYSLPATSSFPDYSLFNFFNESAPTTIDGVSSGVVTGSYYVIGAFFPTLVLDVTDAVGTPGLNLYGPKFFSVDYVPASNPLPYLQDDVVPTFTPGTYTLQDYGSPFNPLSSPIPYTLTITSETATAATPEPPSLTLLATGALGLIGLAAIKRRRQVLSH